MTRTLLALVALLSSGLAQAADYTFSSTTFFRGYVRPGQNDVAQHLPFYELVRLTATDLGVAGLSIQASLWGQLEVLDKTPPDGRATGDVNVLLLRYEAPEKSRARGLELQLGRQFTSLGPSLYEQFDGLSVSYRSPFRLDFSLFGGMPTGTRFIRQSWPIASDDLEYGYNWVAGGRLAYRMGRFGVLGVSYRQERLHGRMAFHDLGWDGSIYPIERLELLGDAVLDLSTSQLKEARAAAKVEILHGLDLGAGYRFTAPNLFIPQSSIFSVFSNEVHQQIYGELYWAITRRLDWTTEAGAVLFGDACLRGTGGVGQQCESATELRLETRANLRLGLERQHRLTAEVERVGSDEGGFVRFRVAGATRLHERVSLIADVDLYRLDEPGGRYYIAGDSQTRWSFAGSGYLNFVLRQNVMLLAGGQALVTPLLSKGGAFTLRLTWLLDSQPPKGASTQVARSALSATSIARGGAL
ncbi:MAG: hypothetical protein IT371_25815 [Deltaproteobacteria bacterium]|nr:hypothetical protein [Deltaproteobacteria bacterium]